MRFTLKSSNAAEHLGKTLEWKRETISLRKRDDTVPARLYSIRELWNTTTE